MDTSGGSGATPTGRQQLASELRRLRELAGVSGRVLAQRIGVSQSKVSRIESGTVAPSLPEVNAWARVLGAPQETQNRLTALTETAYDEVLPWRTALQQPGNAQDRIQDLELTATRVRAFQPLVIPGLLQTAEYAKRVISLFYRQYTDREPAREVAVRLHRQSVLYEESRRFEFLILESALRWLPGAVRLQLAQLDRLASLNTLENISIGLIPLAAEAVALLTHNFVIYDENGTDEAVVTVETIHADMTVDTAEHVALYRSRWSALRQMALHDDDARQFLAGIITELRDDTGPANHSG